MQSSLPSVVGVGIGRDLPTSSVVAAVRTPTLAALEFNLTLPSLISSVVFAGVLAARTTAPAPPLPAAPTAARPGAVAVVVALPSTSDFACVGGGAAVCCCCGCGCAAAVGVGAAVRLAAAAGNGLPPRRDAASNFVDFFIKLN